MADKDEPPFSQSSASEQAAGRNDTVDGQIYENRGAVLRKINKFYGVFTCITVITSIVICAIQGSKHKDPKDFLILSNIVFTSFIAVVHVWWYKRAHLTESKVWLLLLIYSVLLVQCVTSDIYVFISHDIPSVSPRTTHMAKTSHRHLTGLITLYPAHTTSRH